MELNKKDTKLYNGTFNYSKPIYEFLICPNDNHRSVTWPWFHPVASLYAFHCCFTIARFSHPIPLLRLQFCNWRFLIYGYCWRDRFWHLCLTFARVRDRIQPSVRRLLTFTSIFLFTFCRGCSNVLFNCHLETICVYSSSLRHRFQTFD